MRYLSALFPAAAAFGGVYAAPNGISPNSELASKTSYPTISTSATDSVHIKRDDGCAIFSAQNFKDCQTSTSQAPTSQAITIEKTVTQAPATVVVTPTPKTVTAAGPTITQPGPTHTQRVIISKSTSLSPFTTATETETRPATTETFFKQDATGGFTPVSTATSFTTETKYATGTHTYVSDIPIATEDAFSGARRKTAASARKALLAAGVTTATLLSQATGNAGSDSSHSKSGSQKAKADTHSKTSAFTLPGRKEAPKTGRKNAKKPTQKSRHERKLQRTQLSYQTNVLKDAGRRAFHR